MLDGQPLSVGTEVWYAEGQVLREQQPFREGVVTGFETAGAGSIFVLVRARTDGRIVKARLDDVFLANASSGKDQQKGPPDDHCGLMHLNEATLLHSTLVAATW